MGSNGHMDRTVVVGVDGSKGSRIALDWTLDKKDRLGEVRTVMAFRLGPFAEGFGPMPGVEGDVGIFREAAISRLRKVLEATDPDLFERAQVVESKAGPALVQASADADLLVVGSRGRSALAETLLGSIGSYCVKHSKVPVVVIPESADTGKSLARVVVGIDSSANSKAALRWALDHVDPDGTVIAVASYNPVWNAIDGYMPDLKALEDQTRSNLDEAVEEVVGSSGGGPTIEREVRIGDPRIELRRAGEAADLLVIGARGHQSVSYLLLGSVATSLLHHPASATAVVPC